MQVVGFSDSITFNLLSTNYRNFGFSFHIINLKSIYGFFPSYSREFSNTAAQCNNNTHSYLVMHYAIQDFNKMYH